MPESKPNDSCVFLFSSNSEPLYSQNILELLAAPPGAIRQWRYAEEWVSEELAEAVRDCTIAGLPALLHFSLQQQAQLQEPALLPIRTGRVVDAKIVANGFFVIRVKLEDDASLTSETSGDGGAGRYKALLDEQGVPRPYGSSASIGAALPADKHFTTGGRESGLFENNVKWLAKTDTFRSARFFKFYRLAELEASEEISPDEKGSFRLRAGKTYQLELFLFQPHRVDEGSTFEIFCDRVAVSIIGRRTFDVASRYDLVRVQLAISLPAEINELNTALTIAPQGSFQGPKLELPLRIAANRVDRAATVGGSALTLLLLAAQALVTAEAVKIVLLGAAVVLGTLLALRNRPIAPLAGGIHASVSPAYPPAPPESPVGAGHEPHAASHPA